ncbi:hypothetical protein CYMTET_56716 [Cymbomonas tetramitiformis]|uniref:Uncharacterized protein n=1 Tax=Cymbomonas tetramitiformis TaxID=36881 RepID=A0AAE0EM11_9CHLO|nr:hypothetical protein CYMTET_56716 [Cymbomonas tetramitiformis]
MHSGGSPAAYDEETMERGALKVPKKIDTRVIDRSFFQEARDEGVICYEPCGDLCCAGLEMLLRCGVKVNMYLYQDVSPASQAVASRTRGLTLSRRHPDLLPAAAIQLEQLPPNLEDTKLEDLVVRERRTVRGTVVRDDDIAEEGESREVNLDEKAIAMGYSASELRMPDGMGDEELAGVLGLVMDRRRMELLFAVAEASITGLPRSAKSQEVEHAWRAYCHTHGKPRRNGGHSGVKPGAGTSSFGGKMDHEVKQLYQTVQQEALRENYPGIHARGRVVPQVAEDQRPSRLQDLPKDGVQRIRRRAARHSYNAAKQQSTGVAPFTLLFAQKATVPPDLRKRPELNFEDQEEETIADDLLQRTNIVKTRMVHAGCSLEIAQHRDTLLYEHRRSGGYEPKPHQFKAGDFVYIRKTPRSGMEVVTKPAILKLVKVQRDGVVVLEDSTKLGEQSTVQNKLAAVEPKLKEKRWEQMRGCYQPMLLTRTQVKVARLEWGLELVMTVPHEVKRLANAGSGLEEDQTRVGSLGWHRGNQQGDAVGVRGLTWKS